MMNHSEKPDKGTIVYVGGLVGDVTKEELEAEFEKFGKLTRVWVAFNPPGFAFVEYEKKEDAESAVTAMHNATRFGSKLRVEISRGRGRRGGGRGGMPGRGGGGRDFDFPPAGRGTMRGGFRGSRGGDMGRGRGILSSRGRGGFGGHPFDREDSFESSYRGGMGGRFDDFKERRRPEFPERDFGPPRDPRGPARDYEIDEPPRGFPPGRDVQYPLREPPARDYPPRDLDRGFPPRDVRGPREFGGRDYVGERELNGVSRGFGGGDLPPVDRGYPGGREYGGPGPAPLGPRDFGPARDLPPARDIPVGREFPPRDIVPPRDYELDGFRDIGMRRDEVRDFNPPRDIANPREFGGRPSRIDYADADRFGPPVGRGGYGDGEIRRGGGFGADRFSGGDFGGSGDYGGYGARDRFRSRSPIRGSRPPIY